MSGFLMKYEITPRYLTGPSKRRPVLYMDQVVFVVAHDTGNPGSTAAGNVSYYEASRNEMEASAHIFVDDRNILECIPFLTGTAEKAWHVGYSVTADNERFGVDANDAAGGIELCYGGSIDIEEAYRRYVWTLAYASYTYDLNPAYFIVGHYMLDPQRRSDPRPALALLGKTFEDLVQDVVDEYNECLEPETPEYSMTADDANTIIRFLGAAYACLEDTAAEDGRAELHRLANELRKQSGQAET
jgi:N-acetylmuramoyl-L-alanine amidase